MVMPCSSESAHQGRWGRREDKYCSEHKACMATVGGVAFGVLATITFLVVGILGATSVIKMAPIGARIMIALGSIPIILAIKVGVYICVSGR